MIVGSIDTKDISIVVQGAVDPKNTPKCLTSIRKYLPGAEIILSTWEGTDCTGLDYDVLVLNKDPGCFVSAPGILDNLKRQLVSTLYGIKKANRKFILKIRSDIELYNNKFLKFFGIFNKWNDNYKIFQERILVNSLYTRDSMLSGYLYHPSDWIYFGLNKDINTLFNIDLPNDPVGNAAYLSYHYPINPAYIKNNRRYAPEQYIFVNCLRKNGKKIDFIDHTDITIEHRIESAKYLVNNFVFLDYKKDYNILFNKYDPSKNFHGEKLYSFYDFESLYQKYCDHSYNISTMFRSYNRINKIKNAYSKIIYEQKLLIYPFKIIGFYFLHFIKYFCRLFHFTFRCLRYVLDGFFNKGFYIVNNIDTRDISVVVQGSIDPVGTDKCLKSIRKYLPGSEIIFSTWKGINCDYLDIDELVLNDDPGAVLCSPKFNYYNNINRQLVSTQSGIQRCTRKYILKLRSDNVLTSNKFLKYFNRYNKRCTQYSLFNKRLLVASLFSRKFFGIATPFRVCDWFTFGLSEDVKKYYMNISVVKEPEFSLYFEKKTYKFPKEYPSPYHFHRFTTEQYYPLNCFQKFFNDIKMDDLTDINEKIIKQSDYYLVNNFVFLDYRQHGIYLKKFDNRWYEWSKDETLAPDLHWNGFYRHYIFLKDYKKYCNKFYILPLDCENIRRTIKKMWKDENK